MFNKYEFKEEQTKDIIQMIEEGAITDSEAIITELESNIANANIYYSDSFKIVQELQVTDFSYYIDNFGAKTISDMGYYALREYIFEESDIVSYLEDFLESFLERQDSIYMDEREKEEDRETLEALEEE